MSDVTIRIPTPLRSFTGGADEVAVDGGSVAEALGNLVARHEGLARHLFNAQGGLRNFVNIYVDDQHIRALGGLDAPVGRGAVVHIVPAVAGGAP